MSTSTEMQRSPQQCLEQCRNISNQIEQIRSYTDRNQETKSQGQLPNLQMLETEFRQFTNWVEQNPNIVQQALSSSGQQSYSSGAAGASGGQQHQQQRNTS